MDASELRQLQAPLKQRYRDDAQAAHAALHARADFSDGGVTTTVATWNGPVRAGFHPTTGGDGSDACSGDMLLQALLACAGVTLRSVATAMGVEIHAAVPPRTPTWMHAALLASHARRRSACRTSA